MTTGEKLAFLRKKKGITQEQLSAILKVSRQSVSRWEMDIAFPETDKLIRLSKLFECSIDFLLNDAVLEKEDRPACTSIDSCCQFIRDCGYFFLATSVDDHPRLRPLGMIYSNSKELFIATDRRKDVYSDLTHNSQIEIAAYNALTRKWIRISGNAEPDDSLFIKDEMMNAYPALKQKYLSETEMFLAIFNVVVGDVTIT